MNTITVSDFVGEAEVFINEIDPNWDYSRADLYGFISAAWPYDGSPADAASEFRVSVEKQRTEVAIEEALGEFSVSDDSPCGGTGYYEPNEENPYRVLFCDGASCESFKTLEEAVTAATAYAEEMRSEAN